MDKLFTSFDHLFTSFGINWPVIWSDSSVFVCLWLILVVLITIWAAKNYQNSVHEEYMVKVTCASIAWEEEREKLKSENRFLNEAFQEYRNDAQENAIECQTKIDELSARTDELSAKNNQLSAEVEELSKKVPKRNADGTFAVTTGKGHQRKRKPDPEHKQHIQYYGRVQLNFDPERDWTKATKEELLAEAKRRYPVGTKFICIWSESERVVSDVNYWDDSDEIEEVWLGVEYPASGLVYSYGQWAQIISK